VPESRPRSTPATTAPASPWRITLADVTVGDEERDALLAVLDSGWLSMGPATKQFETALSDHLAAEHVLAVTNGTAALHLAAVALGIGPGDEVICPSLTFVASAAAMRQAGATVRLADSTSLDDFSLDPAEIDRLAGPRTRAVVVVHYGGFPVDMDAIGEIAARRGLLVIEDAAHALGSKLDGRTCGTLGDAACFSFFPNKNMTTGEGGAVVCRDPEAAERARSLRSHAMTTLTWDRHRGHAASYDVLGVGFNYRIDELRAALGLAQLGRLGALNEARARLGARYRERLAGRPSLRVPYLTWRGHSAHHLFVVLASSQDEREHLRAALRAAGVQTSVHYPAIHRFSSYRDGTSLPVAEQIADRVLTLPLHPGLKLDDVDEVCDLLLEAADHRSGRKTA
jgi:dTDP-4-amino-4,6-dideoxygalactose transaminase